MRKSHILLAVMVAITLSGLLYAGSRNSPFATKVHRDNGDTRVPLYFSVSSQTWTTLLSADIRRRYAILHTTSATTVGICLSTATTTGLTCAEATYGTRLGVGQQTYEDYNTGALYGKTAAGSANAALLMYGEYQYDSGDSSTY